MGRMQDNPIEVMMLTKSLRNDYLTETNAFLVFLNKAESGKTLDSREKELINVALAVKSGATRNEIMETGFMAVIT